jgi:hypothetical protein
MFYVVGLRNRLKVGETCSMHVIDKKILETYQKQITSVLMVYNTVPTDPNFGGFFLPPSSCSEQSKKRAEISSETSVKY